LSKALVLAAAVMAVVMSAYGQEEKVSWEGSFAAASRKAKQTGRTVLADFTSHEN